jgi:hypothetical protein
MSSSYGRKGSSGLGRVPTRSGSFRGPARRAALLAALVSPLPSRDDLLDFYTDLVEPSARYAACVLRLEEDLRPEASEEAEELVTQNGWSLDLAELFIEMESSAFHLALVLGVRASVCGMETADMCRAITNIVKALAIGAIYVVSDICERSEEDDPTDDWWENRFKAVRDAALLPDGGLRAVLARDARTAACAHGTGMEELLAKVSRAVRDDEVAQAVPVCKPEEPFS